MIPSGVRDAVVPTVNRFLGTLSEQLKRFAILPRDFTLEQAEVTPTMKLKRRAVIDHFADAVDALYL